MRATPDPLRLLAEDEDPAFYRAGNRAGGGWIRPRRTSPAPRSGKQRPLRWPRPDTSPIHGSRAARRIVERLSRTCVPARAEARVRAGNHRSSLRRRGRPSFHVLVMLAFMPLSEASTRRHGASLPVSCAAEPRQAPARLLGDRWRQQHLVLGDRCPPKWADADVTWRSPGWRSRRDWDTCGARRGAKLHDRFLDDRDATRVWHPHKGLAMPRSSNPLAWPSFPWNRITPARSAGAESRSGSGLIGRLAGRQINLRALRRLHSLGAERQRFVQCMDW